MEKIKGNAEVCRRARLEAGRRHSDQLKRIVPVYTGYLKIIMERPADLYAVMQAEPRDRAENLADLSRRLQYPERVGPGRLAPVRRRCVRTSRFCSTRTADSQLLDAAGAAALARLVLWRVEVPLGGAPAVFRNPARPDEPAR